MHEIDDNFDAAEKIWSPLIGQFILNFGYIEDEMHTVITWYISKSLVSEAAITHRFQQRFDLFLTILGSLLTKPDHKSALAEIKQAIPALKKTRDLLAHNPLTLNFSEDTNGVLKCDGFEITSSKKNEVSISIKSLSEKASELSQLRSKLTSLMVEFLSLQTNHLPTKQVPRA